MIFLRFLLYIIITKVIFNNVILYLYKNINYIIQGFKILKIFYSLILVILYLRGFLNYINHWNIFGVERINILILLFIKLLVFSVEYVLENMVLWIVLKQFQEVLLI